jgi:Spy/CpxP family protein refolding chaperone
MRFIIILLLITTLYGDHDEHNKKHHINKELSHLELSKEQHSEVKIILKEFRTELKEYKEFEEEIEDKRKDLFIEDNLNTTEIDKLNNVLDNKAHEIEKKFLIKMHTILTPKQRKKFIDYFDDWNVQ